MEYRAIKSTDVMQVDIQKIKLIPMKGMNYIYFKNEFLENNLKYCCFSFLSSFFKEHAEKLRIKRKSLEPEDLFKLVQDRQILDEELQFVMRQRKIEDGCTPEDCCYLCELHNVSCYIITHENGLIEKKVSNSNHNHNMVIVARIFDNHFYPISDKKNSSLI